MISPARRPSVVRNWSLKSSQKICCPSQNFMISLLTTSLRRRIGSFASRPRGKIEVKTTVAFGCLAVTRFRISRMPQIVSAGGSSENL